MMSLRSAIWPDTSVVSAARKREHRYGIAVLQRSKTKVSFAVIGTVVGKGKPAMEWQVFAQVSLRDDVATVVRGDLFDIEIE